MAPHHWCRASQSMVKSTPQLLWFLSLWCTVMHCPDAPARKDLLLHLFSRLWQRSVSCFQDHLSWRWLPPQGGTLSPDSSYQVIWSLIIYYGLVSSAYQGTSLKCHSTPTFLMEFTKTVLGLHHSSTASLAQSWLLSHRFWVLIPWGLLNKHTAWQLLPWSLLPFY